MADEIVSAESSVPAPLTDQGAVNALLNPATQGDATCLPMLRQLFRDPDRGPDLIRAFGLPPA